MDAAAQLIVRQGYLPLPMEELAQRAQSSKALLYSYFPTQYDLFNALLLRELGALAAAGLTSAVQVGDLDESVLRCAMLYFEHVAQCGPLLHILITDLYMADRIDPAVRVQGKALAQRLWRLAQQSVPYSAAEFQAALEMMAAVPEEAGTLAFEKRLERQAARELCQTLVLSSLRALHSPERMLEHGA